MNCAFSLVSGLYLVFRSVTSNECRPLAWMINRSNRQEVLAHDQVERGGDP